MLLLLWLLLLVLPLRCCRVNGRALAESRAARCAAGGDLGFSTAKASRGGGLWPAAACGLAVAGGLACCCCCC